MPNKVKVYDREEGQVRDMYLVQAREACANDRARYTMTKPSPWPPVADAKKSAPAKPKPAVVAASAPAAVPVGADDLTTINGIGKAVAQRLYAVGVTTFAAMADMSAELLDQTLDGVVGMTVEKAQNWIEQAAELANDGSPPEEADEADDGEEPAADAE